MARWWRRLVAVLASLAWVRVGDAYPLAHTRLHAARERFGLRGLVQRSLDGSWVVRRLQRTPTTRLAAQLAFLTGRFSHEAYYWQCKPPHLPNLPPDGADARLLARQTSSGAGRSV